MGLSWDEAEGILERAVGRGLARRVDEPVRFIGVDETSFQKRHEYVTASKIQEVKYRARGYRNRDNFRRAILFRCGDLDMNPL